MHDQKVVMDNLDWNIFTQQKTYLKLYNLSLFNDMTTNDRLLFAFHVFQYFAMINTTGEIYKL